MKCHEKKPYATREHANVAKRRAYHERQASLTVYRCPECHNWHLTHRDEKGRWVRVEITADHLINVWLKIGLVQVQELIERGSVPRASLMEAIELIERDTSIPDLWKLAELPLLKAELTKL